MLSWIRNLHTCNVELLLVQGLWPAWSHPVQCEQRRVCHLPRDSPSAPTL